MKFIISGILLFFAVIWAGTYILHILPVDHWAVCPTFLTLMGLLLSGVGLVIYGIGEVEL